jgi:hypothetical protein
LLKPVVDLRELGFVFAFNLFKLGDGVFGLIAIHSGVVALAEHYQISRSAALLVGHSRIKTRPLYAFDVANIADHHAVPIDQDIDATRVSTHVTGEKVK